MLVGKLNVGSQRKYFFFKEVTIALCAFMWTSARFWMYFPTMKFCKHNIKMNNAFCVQQNSKRHSILFFNFIYGGLPGVIYRWREWMTHSKMCGFLGWFSCKLEYFTRNPLAAFHPVPEINKHVVNFFLS